MAGNSVLTQTSQLLLQLALLYMICNFSCILLRPFPSSAYKDDGMDLSIYLSFPLHMLTLKTICNSQEH